MFLCPTFLILFLMEDVDAQTNRNINIFLVNERENIVALEAVESAVRILDEKLLSLNITTISAGKDDPNTLLKLLCEEYHNALNSSAPPFLIFDSTLQGLTSEAVKFFTAALALPTISSSFGHVEQFRLWNEMSERKRGLLVHVTPPAYLISSMLESMIWRQGIKKAVIFYDEDFDMVIRFRNVLKKMRVYFIIQAIKVAVTENSWTDEYLNFTNYFIFGKIVNICTVLEKAGNNSLLNKIYKWYAVTLDGGPFECNCVFRNMKIILINPLKQVQKEEGMNLEDHLGKQFFRNLFMQSYMSLYDYPLENWTKQNFITCDEYNGTNTPKREGVNLIDKIIHTKNRIDSFQESYGPLIVTNRKNFMKFTMNLNLFKVDDQASKTLIRFGQWNSEYDAEFVIENENVIQSFVSTEVIRIVVVEQRPFVFVDKSHPRGFNGYCIDMMERIAQMIHINFTLELATENKFGELDDNGNWNGLVKDLIDRKADVGLGSIQISAAHKYVIDFTVPFYEPVGILILMKNFRNKPSLAKFIYVLDSGVWIVSIAAFVLSSLLIWIFDKYSPKSYQNNMEKYKDQTEKKIFNLKESLWFSLTSMSPEGGGEIPKNMSGRIIAGTWWLFAFLFLTSYTANLSAILTVSLINNNVHSIHDMERLLNLQFSTQNGSSAMEFFKRMDHIENLFHTKWEEITFSSNMSEVERSRISVFTYPVQDRYGKLWKSMNVHGMPNTLEEAAARIRTSISPLNGFAFIGDATDCRYMEMISCDFEIIGEEFSSKPYTIALQQESHLKSSMDFAISQLSDLGVLGSLKTKWWDNNPNKKECIEPENQYDGIGMRNLGGVFISLIVGIGIAGIILIFEYLWYKRENSTLVISLQDTDNNEPHQG